MEDRGVSSKNLLVADQLSVVWQVDELRDEKVKLSDISQHTNRVVAMINYNVIRKLAAGSQVPWCRQQEQDLARKVGPEIGQGPVGVLDKDLESRVVNDAGFDKVHRLVSTGIVRDDPLLFQHDISQKREDEHIC